MKNAMLLASAMLLLSSYAGHAQDADIAAGEAYAERVCAACHAVLVNENMSPLADTPGMTELALTVWMQSSHPTMPNIMLKPDELRNVVAYIRSLDRKG